MKSIRFLPAFAGLLLCAASASAAEPAPAAEASVQNSAEHALLLEQVSKDVTANPKQAGEIVKQAIIQSKADTLLVAKIVKAAVQAAPEQAEVIRKYALAVAPDAKKEVEAMIAAVLMGDEVAGKYADVKSDKYSDVESDKYSDVPKETADAGDEPEGSDPENNTVWLTNEGSLRQGGHPNPLSSRTPNTGDSPNWNHNRDGVIRGGGTVIIRPTTSTSP